MRKLKLQRGFTLIELLVVIAILGVLAVVALPNVLGFIGSGEVEAANAEAHTVQTAVVAYMVSEDGAVPESTDDIDLIGTLKGVYTINEDGSITGTGGWANLSWSGGQWVKD